MMMYAVVLAALVVSHAAADVATAKIAPALRKAIRANASKHNVLVLTVSQELVKGTSIASARVRAGMPRAVQVSATAAQITKMAASPDVIAIVPDEPPVRPPVPGPQYRPELMNMQPNRSPLPNTWMASDVVGARAAWQLGYTGQGVKVAVIDDRIDFGHSDLHGTQARVEDPNSPYYGWPIVFDPFSMAKYASTGRTNGTGYCETRPFIPSPTGNYKLPNTSKSGIYRTGAHPSYWLKYTNPTNRVPVVLVADEHVAGVYDTVYVDLDKDYDLAEEKPCRKGDEISWHDLDGDGIADLSGGMVYFIADGVNPIPGSDWLYNLPPPANGSIVCFTGAFDKYESHGTLVASAIAAQGRIGADEVPYGPVGEGIVRGMAPDAKIISIGNVYSYGASMYDAVLFAVLGYDGLPNTGDEADITNMSFGYSNIDNDGWDYLSRYITYLNATMAPRTTFFGATGNGGPGYGTVTSPGAAPSVISVGASTLYGSVPVLDEILSIDQVLFGDIQPWSNRGPSALGTIEPNVVAVGAWATGDVPIFGDGAASWAVWGGTSLACPMAAGTAALFYEAYTSARGERPTYDVVRDLMMAGARDLSYPVLEQGAGQVDAEKLVRLALGQEVLASPSSWQVGQTAPAFGSSVEAGRRYSNNFILTNPTSKTVVVDLSSESYVKSSELTFPLQVINAEESEAFAGPAYLVDLLPLIPEGTDLLRVRAVVEFDKFSLSDPRASNPGVDNAFSLTVYDWTDLNSNGVLWHDDQPANNVVNEGELDEHELNRYSYSAPLSNCLEVSVQNPLSRHHDGIFLGLQHYRRSEAIPVSQVMVTLEFYRRDLWSMLDVKPARVVLQPRMRSVFRATFSTARLARPGVYSGAIRLTCDDGSEQLIPVAANVTAPPGSSIGGALAVWGSDHMNAPYDNGVVRGAFDWGWRAESGDWRFYMCDPTQVPGAATLLANVNWQHYPTDVDLLLYGPNASDFFSREMPSVFGPHSMAYIGGSFPTNVGSAVWPFMTATGGVSEWVSGPVTGQGNHLAMLHSVLSAGKSSGEVLSVNAGPVVIDPPELTVPAGQPFASSICVTPHLYLLQGMEARAYGFSQPLIFENLNIRQDPIDSPESSGWQYDVVLSGAGLLEVSTSSVNDIDLDLYVLRDANSDDRFDWLTELVALSGDITASEKVSIPLPADGRYRIAVHGYRVRPEPQTANVRIDAIQGNNMTVQVPWGRVTPGQSVDLTIDGSSSGPGEGIILIGPTGAPSAMQVRVHAR